MWEVGGVSVLLQKMRSGMLIVGCGIGLFCESHLLTFVRRMAFGGIGLSFFQFH